MVGDIKCVHVVPVGTSLLGNVARSSSLGGRVRELGFEGWDRWSPDDPRQETLCERRSEVHGLLREFLDSSRYEASAELYPLNMALNRFGCVRERSLVILYSTNTCNSRIAREALADFLRREGFEVVEKEIIAIRSQEDFDNGLVSILDEVIEEIIKWRDSGARVYVNATPGFKAEVSFLVIASLMSCVDGVYYSHESFRELVVLPGLPLAIRGEFLEKLRYFEEPREPSEAEEIIGSSEILRDLLLRGLIQRKDGKYMIREWIKKIISVSPTRCL